MTRNTALAVVDKLADAGYLTHLVTDGPDDRVVVVPLRQHDTDALEHEDIVRLLALCDTHDLQMTFSECGAHLSAR